MAQTLSEMNPGELAFVGDAVYSLFVRRYIAVSGKYKNSELHPASAEIVCCEAQAKGADSIFENLTEEEKEVFIKGKNMHHGSYPRHSSRGDYCKATGLEALFGWLYLSGQSHRAEELFSIITGIQVN